MNFKIVAGLGNPEKAYARTYHNVGLLFVEYLVKRLHATEGTLRGSFHTFRCGPLVVARLASSMNESGRAVRQLLRFCRARPQEFLLVHDDADLPLGTWRFHFGRGAAGHRGVESVMRELHTREFWRLRLGTRSSPRGTGRIKAGAFALSPMTPSHIKIIYREFEEVADVIVNVIEKEIPTG